MLLSVDSSWSEKFSNEAFSIQSFSFFALWTDFEWRKKNIQFSIRPTSTVLLWTKLLYNCNSHFSASYTSCDDFSLLTSNTCRWQSSETVARPVSIDLVGLFRYHTNIDLCMSEIKTTFSVIKSRCQIFWNQSKKDKIKQQKL